MGKYFNKISRNLFFCHSCKGIVGLYGLSKHVKSKRHQKNINPGLVKRNLTNFF